MFMGVRIGLSMLLLVSCMSYGSASEPTTLRRENPVTFASDRGSDSTSIGVFNPSSAAATPVKRSSWLSSDSSPQIRLCDVEMELQDGLAESKLEKGDLCCDDSACETPWSLWVWGAPTYSANAFQSLAGFSEGLNLGYRVTDNVGLYGSIGFNHDSRSTQILGTVGVQKFGNPDGSSLLDRSSVWVLWDQGTDTEIDDLYLHQFRFVVGVVTSERNEIGMSFSVPTSGGLGVNALSPLGGPGYLTSASSFIGPYVKRQVGNVGLTGTIGYSDGAGGVAIGGSAEMPLTERSNLYIDGKAASGDVWAGSVGLAVPFGAADTKWY